MEEINKAMPGSVIPINISISGLGNMHVSSESVSLTARFYAHHIREHNEELKTTPAYTKEDMTPDTSGDCDDYVVLVDTTGLGYGQLTGIIEVTYPSNGSTATEVIMARTGINLYTKGM